MHNWIQQVMSSAVYAVAALAAWSGFAVFLLLGAPLAERGERLVDDAAEREHGRAALPDSSASQAWTPTADSSELRLVGRWNADGFASAVAVDGRVVYRGDWWAVEITDAADLSSPMRKSRVPFLNNSTVEDIALSRGRAYVLENDFNANGFPPPNHFTMTVVDVSDPANPQKIGGFGARGEPHRLAVAGNYVYVANGGGYADSRDVDDRSGLWVIDVSDPARPRKVGAHGWRFSEVTVSGERAYLIGEAAEGDSRRLHVFDTSNPTALQKIGVLPVDGSPTSVAVAGDYAHVGTRGGLRVFDLSGPAGPRQTAAFDTRGSVGEIAVEGTRVWFATHDASAPNGAGRLHVIDASNPAAVRLEGTLLLEGHDEHEGVTLRGLAASAGCAYVATWRDGLLVAKLPADE